MDMLSMIKHRRSIRKYLDKKVDWDKLEKIAEAGIYAPNPGGRQGTTVIMLDDADVIERIGAVDIHFHVYRAAYFLERIKQVFDLADRISIIDKSNDETVELCLTLYTHKHLSATGEQITP